MPSYIKRMQAKDPGVNFLPPWDECRHQPVSRSSSARVLEPIKAGRGEGALYLSSVSR